MSSSLRLQTGPQEAEMKNKCQFENVSRIYHYQLFEDNDGTFDATVNNLVTYVTDVIFVVFFRFVNETQG